MNGDDVISFCLKDKLRFFNSFCRTSSALRPTPFKFEISLSVKNKRSDISATPLRSKAESALEGRLSVFICFGLELIKKRYKNIVYLSSAIFLKFLQEQGTAVVKLFYTRGSVFGAELYMLDFLPAFSRLSQLCK